MQEADSGYQMQSKKNREMFGPFIVIYPGLLIAALILLFLALSTKSFKSKIILSALCGILVAAFVVIIPAFMKTSKLQLDPTLEEAFVAVLVPLPVS